MDSLNFFADSKLPPKGRARPLWLVAGLASILPGGGHFLLGKTQSGFLLLGPALLLGAMGTVISFFQAGQLQWLTLRAATVIYLFGVVDACFLNYEIADGREHTRQRPRQAAFSNLLLYGLGYWQLEQRALAGMGLAAGVLLHVLMASRHPLLLVAAELGVCALAWHAHQMAEQRAPTPAVAGVGVRLRVRDSHPAWLSAALAGFIAVHVGLLAFSLHAAKQLEASLRVDQSRALAVEPYYRNSSYGVQVELNAPGWSFLTAAPDEFLHARHVSRDAEFALRSMPRVLGFPGAAEAARTALQELQISGIALGPTSEEAVQLAGLPGWRIRAEGVRGNKRRQVEILAAGKGWRNYVLCFEWGADNAKFGAAELKFLLAKVDLTGSRPPADAQAETAR